MELRTEFWELLRQSRPGSDFSDVPFLTDEDAAREFQVFEVLVVDALRFLDPGREWRVLASREGEGIDFRGSTRPRKVTVPELTVQKNLVGRTKRQAVASVSLLHEIESLAAPGSAQPVSGVILVLAGGSISSQELQDLGRVMAATRPEVSERYLLEARRFEEFWSWDVPHILAVLHRCLSNEDRQLVAEYLRSIVRRSEIRIGTELERDRTGQAGKRFRCKLRLRQLEPLPKLTVSLRHLPPPGGQAVEVVLPSRMASPGGLEVDLVGNETNEVEVWLRSFAPGRRALGRIEIHSRKGALIESVDLGEAELHATFEPPYFDKPNWQPHRDLEDALRKVQNGAVRAVTVLGTGGSGKSRFCEAVIEQAADEGFCWFRLGHPNTAKAYRRMIYRLFARLLGHAGERSLVDELLDRLRRLLTPFPEAHSRALADYFGDATGAVATEAISGALFALISERCRHRSVLLHLHDLHWADGETLSILGDTIDLLERSQQPFHHGALFLLEGRDRESLRLQSGLFRPPEDWLSFLDARGYQSLELDPWRPEHSREFLKWVLEFREAEAQRPLAVRLPLFERLQEHILESAAGNPMHLIEQLKSLIDREYAKVSERGTVYLTDDLPQEWEPPRRTEELIGSRLAFLRDSAPDAAELLVILGKVGRRVPGALFRRVSARGLGEEAVAALYRIDMATVPRHAAEAFEFLHENYYQVCRDAPVPVGSRLLPAAVEFFTAQPELSARDRFQVAILMASADRPNEEELLEHAVQGLEEASESGDDRLSRDFCRFLLGLPAPTLARSGLDPADLRLQQGINEKLAGSWLDSLETLRRSETDFSSRPLTPELLTKRLTCKAEIVNALVTMMRTDEAMAEIDDALLLIESSGWLGAADPPDPLIHLRDRFWHRRAVTLWWDGEIVEAGKWQRRSYTSGRRQGDLSTVSTSLRELGALLIHRNPRLARRLLEKALETLRRTSQRHHEPALLIEVEILVADLIRVHWIDDDFESLGEILDRAQRLHFRCQERASLYEAPLAALVAGSACALTGRIEEAHHWYKLATSTAMRARAYDETWKARLNLGQVCLDLGELDEAKIHATEAAELLKMGLSDGSWERRAARRSFLAWPLNQCIRVHPDLASRLARYLPEPGTLPDWPDRPGPVTGSCEPPQVLHVRSGDSDYYVME